MFNRDSLPNGLIVLTCETSRLPMVDVELICRSGSASDPEGKAGVASLADNLLTKGTRTMSADSFASILDYIGAQPGTWTNQDESGISLRILSKDLDLGMSLMSDAVLNPAFDPREFENARTQALDGTRRGYDSPSYRLSYEFNRLMYPNHPYGHLSRGDTLSLAGLKLDDVVQFYKMHFLPNNCFIVAVGDIQRADFLKAVKARFGNWQPGPVPAISVPDVAYPAKLRVKLITRPDMNQTYIMFGQPGISMSSPDRLATNLAVYVLGGSPLASRLGDVVREKSGLAYDVRAGFNSLRYPGAFTATVQTVKPKEALKLMFQEINKMQENGVTQKELIDAQNYMTGSFPLLLGSNQGKLKQIENVELYGLGLDWLDKYPSRIRALTLDDLNRAMQSHIHPGQYIMVVIGNVTKDDLGLTDAEWVE
jgi:zinc protease